MKNLIKVLLLLTVINLTLSCRRNLEGPQWDTQILTPIISTELRIKDLVDTSDVLSSGSNNVISITYTDDFYKLENPLDSLVGLSIEPFSSFFTLDSLALEDINISQAIVLDSFKAFENGPFGTSGMINDSAPLTQFQLDLLMVGDLPPLNIQQDISSLLEEAVLSQAFFDVEIENNTEFDLENLTYEISNTANGFVLLSKTIPLIPAGTTFTDNLDLANEIGDNPILGNIDVSIDGASITVPAVPGVSRFIYSHSVVFNAGITDIKVKRANAQFPAQTVVDSEAAVDIMASGTEKITFARIKQGVINLRAFNTIPTDLSLRFAIPNLVSSTGEGFVLEGVINNDFNSSVNALVRDFSFNDFDFDLTVPPTHSYNAFKRLAKGDISATDGVQAISLQDTLSIEVSVTEITPSYVRGFLGQEVFNVSDTIGLDLISGIDGNLDFNKITLDINFLNDMGVSPIIKINTLRSLNSGTGAVSDYVGDKGPFTVTKAIENGLTFNSMSSTISLDNAENLISILPDKIIYDIDIAINPDADTANPHFDDFLHSGASLASSLNINIPFELGPSANFSLMDTATIKSQDRVDIPEEFKEGTLSILATNRFPLEANIKLFFLDPNGIIVDSLASEEFIKAAETSGTGEVINATMTKVDFENINRSRLDKMLNAEDIIFTVVLSTDGKDNIKILDTYSMGLQLVGDFGYTIKN